MLLPELLIPNETYPLPPIRPVLSQPERQYPVSLPDLCLSRLSSRLSVVPCDVQGYRTANVGAQQLLELYATLLAMKCYEVSCNFCSCSCPFISKVFGYILDT